MPTLRWSSLEDGKKWVADVISSLNRPCLVLLSGEMGAGKTQIVRWFLTQLGVTEVASPTFAVHHQYASPGGPVDHVDLYRVESDEDLESTGFWDLIREPQTLVFVEWADRLPEDAWPLDQNIMRIHIQKLPPSDEARQIEFHQVVYPALSQ